MRFCFDNPNQEQPYIASYWALARCWLLVVLQNVNWPKDMNGEPLCGTMKGKEEIQSRSCIWICLSSKVIILILASTTTSETTPSSFGYDVVMIISLILLLLLELPK